MTPSPEWRGPHIRLAPSSAVRWAHFFSCSTPRARTSAWELTRFAWRGRTLHVVRPSPARSRALLTAGTSAGSSGERKSSTPSKPHFLMRRNKGSISLPTRVVQTIVFTPYFMRAAPFLVLGPWSFVLWKNAVSYQQSAFSQNIVVYLPPAER